MLTKSPTRGKRRFQPVNFPGALPPNIRKIQEVAPPAIEMATGAFLSCKNLPIPWRICDCGDLNHGYQTIQHLCGCVVLLETFSPMTRDRERYYEGRHCQACYPGSTTAEHDRLLVAQIWGEVGSEERRREVAQVERLLQRQEAEVVG